MKRKLSIPLCLIVSSMLVVPMNACGKSEGDNVWRDGDPVIPAVQEAIYNYPSRDCEEYILKTSDFDELKSFYASDLSGNDLFLLNYGYQTPPYGSHNDNFKAHGNTVKFEFLGDNAYSSFEYIICDPELPPSPAIGSDPTADALSKSVYINLNCAALPNYDEQAGFSYRFGKHTDDNGGIQKFINIYNGDNCFATAYVHPYIEISSDWYKNYFNKNLVWGDSITDTANDYWTDAEPTITDVVAETFSAEEMARDDYKHVELNAKGDQLKQFVNGATEKTNLCLFDFQYELYRLSTGKYNYSANFYYLQNEPKVCAVYDMMIYDPNIGAYYDMPNADGTHAKTASISLHVKPLTDYTRGKAITLRFGTCDGAIKDKYINVYYGDECFATAYVSQAVNAPKNWYKSLFTENFLFPDATI